VNDVLVLLAGVLAGVVLSLVYMWIRDPLRDRAVRKDAVQRSQAVVAGKVFEQLTPYLPGFSFNPKDARFLGSPVDFVVFDGLDEGELRRVVFVEVKTNAATLSPRERSVRDAIRERRVEWLEYRAGARTAATVIS
jgi:predicted Holliday junction resolvase-like endonuclease